MLIGYMVMHFVFLDYSGVGGGRSKQKYRQPCFSV